MAFEKEFEAKLYASDTEVSGDMPDRWFDGLVNNAMRIFDRVSAKIGHNNAYQQEMVEPSTNAWANVINPAYRSKSGRTAREIKATKHSQMKEAFNRWYQQLQKAFANNGEYFKAQVANAKSWWAEKMAKTLRMTGDRVRGRGPSAVAAFLLAGDSRATNWIRGGNYMDGKPYSIARVGEESTLKAAIQQRLVQGGTLIINTEFDDITIQAQNELNTSVLNGQRDVAKCDAFVNAYAADKCFCLWRQDDEGRLYLHLQVGLTV